jgi:hypothetical protein
VERPNAGYTLGTGEDGRTVVVGDFQARYDLWVASGDRRPGRLAPVAVERVLAVRPDGFWVVTAGADRMLARVSRDGLVNTVAAFDPRWVAPLTNLLFAPDCNHVALATVHDRHDFHHERELFVIDVRTGRVVLERHRLLTQGGFGAVNHLHMRWHGNSRLLFGCVWGATWLADLSDGSVVEGGVADDGTPLSLFSPPEPRRKTTGFFDHEFGLVFFRGEQEPVGSVLRDGVQVSALSLSPDGAWAAFSSPTDGNLYLVDGRVRRKSVLLPGGACYLSWLPAAPTGPQR